jgi:hypothetical protein
MEIMAKYHQELIFISGMGMQVKKTVTENRKHTVPVWHFKQEKCTKTEKNWTV